LQAILLVLAVSLVMALAAFGVSAKLCLRFSRLSAALVSILGSFRAYRA
jgi:hypothetical protein